jgi:hypothetical protein
MRGQPARNSGWSKRFVAVALALCALVARAQLEPGGAADAPSSAPRVELYQDGFLVEPVDGEHVLARAPFLVRVAPGPGRLSVFATSSAEALAHARALWSAPLVVPRGAGAPSTPLSLVVSDAGLEFHAGLTRTFLDQWGPVLGASQLGDYAALASTLPRGPNVLMTPRQRGNVLHRKDGAQLLPVYRFGSEPVRASDVGALTLFLFFEHPGDPRASWSIVDSVEVVRLRLLAADVRGVAERPLPLRHVLDCGNSGVVQAVRQSDFQRVERLIQQGVDPNTRSLRDNVTLLMCAVGGLDVYGNAVWALLEAGAQVDARTVRGETALLWAVRTGDRGITTPGRLNAVDQLLSRGAEADSSDEDGETPLLGAVAMGHAEIVATLLSAGADPARANTAGDTPLERAHRLGLAEIASLLALYLE